MKVRSDNGTEFRNTQVEEFCNDIGIKHEFSSTYTPQQNGVVERKNRTLITLASAMLDDYGISQRFWAEVINTACHASNRVYLHRFLKKTPYELLIGRKPNISYFRVFGCKCYIFKKRKHLGKFESRCDVGFLIGYSSNSKAYRVFNSATSKIEETCDVEFDETNGSQGEVFACDDVGDEPLREVMKNIAIGQVKPKEEEEIITPSTQDGAPSKDDSKEEASPTIHHDESSDGKDEAPQPPQDVQDEQVVQEQLHFDDTHITSEQAQAQAQNVEPQEDSSSQPQKRLTRTSRNHPIDLVMGDPTGGTRTRRRQYASFSEHYSFVSCLEPSNVDEALEDSDWVMAMQEELNDFTRNEVWVLEERPQDKNIIGTKWVFCNKQDEHGVLIQNKIRLVAKGFA